MKGEKNYVSVGVQKLRVLLKVGHFVPIFWTVTNIDVMVKCSMI